MSEIQLVDIRITKIPKTALCDRDEGSDSERQDVS